MLTDIFSSFDPDINSIIISLPSPIFWLLNLRCIFVFFSNFWIAPNSIIQLTSQIKNVIQEQTSRTSGKHLKGLGTVLTAVFILIISRNIIGLFPYVFRTRRHLFFTISLAIPLWLRLIISSIFTSPTRFIAGILPGGAPDWLNPFLALVESISILLRPITLSFRLAANISAGHIALGLIGIYSATALITSTSNFILLIIIQIFYIIFELGICLIQAYIFCLLLSLYADDHTTV